VVAVPLTEHEMRVLAEIEQELSSSDPTMASALGEVPRSNHAHRVWRYTVLFFAGVTLLLAGVVINQAAVGVVGFIMMLVAAVRVAPVVRAWVRTREPPEGLRRRLANHVAAACRRRDGRSD